MDIKKDIENITEDLKKCKSLVELLGTTSYKKLSEKEKESDRVWADKVIKLSEETNSQ